MNKEFLEISHHRDLYIYKAHLLVIIYCRPMSSSSGQGVACATHLSGTCKTLPARVTLLYCDELKKKKTQSKYVYIYSICV